MMVKTTYPTSCGRIIPIGDWHDNMGSGGVICLKCSGKK